MSVRAGPDDGTADIDAVVVVSFGGPEGPDDVLPFLRNVTRGRNISDERLAEVAEHYHAFGGVSPINQCTRDLTAALQSDLTRRQVNLPVYWGNRNWTPLLDDVVRQMADDGVRRVAAVATSAFGSYSGCRQYAENIQQACAAAGPQVPVVEKLPPFWERDGFLAAMARHTADGLRSTPGAHVVFTAHSIPQAMAATAPYVAQLVQACEQVAERAGATGWSLAYQSRSGPPQVPWLGPDVGDELESLAESGCSAVVVAPIGFVADHMEVIWDLDVEAQARADELGLGFTRVPTVGTAPEFVAALGDMIAERVQSGAVVPACPATCCVYSPR